MNRLDDLYDDAAAAMVLVANVILWAYAFSLVLR